ncbi:MAG TPA: hypothetical protein VM933_07690 [Acidimicrobiales bacterium]|nr:hypothetical protein [Acidimicrobiales bacterium]
MSGRRVVVAGPYPTMGGPEAQATFALVRRLVAAGDDVTVISPQPSAAHLHADPGGPRGAARLASLVRDADELHLRLDASALGAGSDARARLPGRMALRVGLQRVGRSIVRLDRVPATVSRQWANLVLGKAGAVLVSTEAERASLVAAGVDGSKVRVEPERELAEAPLSRRVPAGGSGPATTSASAAELQELIRARAAEDRALHRKASAAPEGTASLPLRHLVRMERAPVRSNKPGGAFLKRAMAKALQWQFDNVIASVNRLHQATIDALDNLESERRPEGDRPVR